MYSRERSLREERVFQRRKTPSFSSSLLDAIYRSIDDETNGEDEFSLYRETTTTVKKKQSTTFEGGDEHERVNLRRAIMIEKWTEKQRIRTSRILNSTSSSSDSSSGGTFSSSETEARSTPSCFTPIRSKQFRTRRDSTQSDSSDYKPKVHDEEGSGSFAKTKLRALKIYGDLKKSKHSPISPGRRIASFLNSLFNAKKDKACSVEAMEDLRSLRKSNPATAATTPVETCSSASSFSRSCLSKTPSSRGKLSNGMKRSVRFYPVSVIVDEDCRPCGVKKVFSATPFQNNVDQARDILRGYNQKKKKSKYGFELRDLVVNGGGEDEEDEEDEDEEDEDEEEEDDGAESYASSDLFELENVIGIGRYREELPVYETTNLKTNQAIAHGLIL